MKFFKVLMITCTLLYGTSTSIANDESLNTGTVVETMESGGYVYVRLEEEDKWLAAQPIPVAVGDKVNFSDGMTMKDFYSRTLDRTFEWIQFVGYLQVVHQFNAEMHAAVAGSEMSGFEKSATTDAPTAGEIELLDGGKTIAVVITDAQQLKDQEISLRAKVMKVNENILGKNWITLQDGTGEAGSKLLATSTELVEIGSIVVAKGVVKTDVDLSMGYKYKVVLEEATFSN